MLLKTQKKHWICLCVLLAKSAITEKFVLTDVLFTQWKNVGVCNNCTDKDNCDKFYIYKRYSAELLSLGRDEKGQLIRKQFIGKTRDEAYQKLLDYVNGVSKGKQNTKKEVYTIVS